MSKVVLSWVGETDLRLFENNENIGPVIGFLQQEDRSGQNCFLLFNYDYERVRPFLDYLDNSFPELVIQPVAANVSDPTSYAEIYPLVFQLLTQIKETPDLQNHQLNILLSPGTPTMQAVWVLLAKTQFPAVCWSGFKGEYSIVELPFKIELEYLASASQNSDQSLQNAFENERIHKSFANIIGESEVMQEQVRKAKKLSQRNVPALILGPTGSGKEVFAQAIHHASPQNQGEFVAINCGALPQELAESILFGHVKGAFTGAVANQTGLIKQADKGTLFLDEIGELSLDLQVKLLRVLQEKTYRPIGGRKDESSNFRLIAATHRNLLDKVVEGCFREDLFYRIAIGVIKLPALNERGDDLELLTQHLLKQINQELADQPGYQSKKLHTSVKKVIKNHAWQGNVRELRATILRVCAWSDNKEITAEEFSDAIIQRQTKTEQLLQEDISQGIDLEEKINQLQTHYILKAKALTGNQITKMAKLLGFKNHQTLTKRLEKLNLE
ncbi:MAG: sigma-54 interaction domain-containing protein [Hydrogenovibrio sp.]